MQTPAQTLIRTLRKLHNPLPLHILDALLCGLVGLAVCGGLAARGQQTGSIPPPLSPPGSLGDAGNPRGNGPGSASDPTLRHMTEQMALKRNTERQQQIVNDTAHLLQLAQQLNDEVAKTSKDQLSVSVVKKADEIEKLAKSIKDKMRDGS
jgi:hypothetical protein